MLKSFSKSTLIIVSGILMIMLAIAACNSQEAEKKEDPATVKPVEAAPAMDTTHMDTATTRPVKDGN
ncbi:MAG: hypothetical protein IT250_03095 [Chitinophagaceae bacterium]|nr:hypothetical protein [Chitinophagaceae bacterium]